MDQSLIHSAIKSLSSMDQSLTHSAIKSLSSMDQSVKDFSVGGGLWAMWKSALTGGKEESGGMPSQHSIAEIPDVGHSKNWINYYCEVCINASFNCTTGHS